MSVTPKHLTPAQLTATAATYYTTPSNTKTKILKATFSNNDTSARTVTFYLVPSGGTAGVTNILVVSKSIPAGDCWECYQAEGHYLMAAETIQALADVAAKVTMHISLAEVV